ncbi:M24 family metallopeptidase [Paenibacillus assamensis]|uniref:M24 family metallopeptidase n=1 Tax=Paenibacillus assamensis TaxID=311244 RepID=UPI000422B81B|nr:Xaa-Pro peptidase family protein [Paenibacillus assamensis]
MNNLVQQLYTAMERNKWDAMLITDPKHVYYFTGFACDPHERFLGIVLALGQDPVLIVPALDGDKAAADSSIKRIATHKDTDNPYLILREQLPSSLHTFGIEKAHMTVQRYEALQTVVQAANVEDIGQELQSLRVVKTDEEIERMQAAADCVETVLGNVVERVRVGMTEAEVVAELEYEMKKQGAEGPSFSTMVLTGDNSALPHGIPGNRRIQEGDLLLFDLGVYLNGYASDITRTFAVGEVSDELKAIYNTVLVANEAAIAAVKPGVTFGSLDRTARDLITEKGYGEYFTHRLGHGLGIDVHEYPSIHEHNEDTLQPGMAFTIEPGVYVPGVGGVRIEDDVVVTKDGVRVLTSFPKELTVIGV